MEIVWNEPSPGPLDLVRPRFERFAAHGLKYYWRIFGLDRNRLERRVPFLDDFRNAGDRTPRTDCRNEDIDFSIRVRPDLFRRRLLMDDRICRVVELLRHPGIWSCFQNFLGPRNGS